MDYCGALAAVKMTALERYRRYLDALDREAVLVADQEGYLDLLTMPEVVDVLCLRDEIDGLRLDSSQETELACLDNVLLKHYRVFEENTPTVKQQPRSH